MDLKGTNNFYVVRSISGGQSNGKVFQIRNSEDPSVIWGEYESAEEARSQIESAHLNLQVKAAFSKFLDQTAYLLNLTVEEVKERL